MQSEKICMQETENKMSVRKTDWLDDQQVQAESASYFAVFQSLQNTINELKKKGVDPFDLANALFNLHIQHLSILDMTDDEIAQSCEIFKNAVTALRDKDPETQQLDTNASN